MTNPKNRHAHMVDDVLRTKPLIKAVHDSISSGDIVVDIGTGLGILAIEAVRAGAKKVYAIECEHASIEAAIANAEAEGVSSNIDFIEKLSFMTELPEKTDLIICETIGSFAFDENILSTLSDAKERFLKTDGQIIPSMLCLYAAGLSYTPEFEPPKDITTIDKNKIITDIVKISEVDFNDNFESFIHEKITFNCTRKGKIEAFALWPQIVWSKGNVTDASPFKETTHWKQGIIEVEHKDVTLNEKVSLEIIVAPHPDDPITMTERMWKWI